MSDTDELPLSLYKMSKYMVDVSQLFAGQVGVVQQPQMGGGRCEGSSQDRQDFSLLLSEERKVGENAN